MARSVADLTPDVLEVIVGYLPTVVKAHAALRVCRSWHAAGVASEWVIEEHDLVRPVRRAHWMVELNVGVVSLKTAEAAEEVLDLYSSLRDNSDAHRTAEACNDLGDAPIAPHSPSPKLPRELSIRADLSPRAWAQLECLLAAGHCETLHVNTFRATCLDAQVFPSLQHLACVVVPSSSAWSCLPPTLMSLSVQYTSDVALAVRLRALPALTSLSIAGNDGIGRAGLLAVAACCPRLTSLDLASTSVDSYALRAILDGCPGITDLNLKDCGRLNDRGDPEADVHEAGNGVSVAVRALVGGGGTLTPAAFHGGTTTTVANIANSSSSSSSRAPAPRPVVGDLLAELRRKTKRAPACVPAGMVDAAGREADPTQAPAPTSAAGHPHADPAYPAAAGPPPPPLADTGITRELGVLLSRHPQLQVLNLSGVGHIDDHGVRCLLRNLPHLRVLRLSRQRGITDEAFVGEDGRFPPNLQHLSLMGCRAITDATLFKISEACPRLRVFWFTATPQMSKAGFLAVIRRCRDLRSTGCYIMMHMMSARYGNAGGIHPADTREDSNAPEDLVDDDVLQTMWACLPNLKQIACGFHRITARAFPTTAVFPSMRDVELDFACVDDTAYRAVIRAFPNARMLCLQSRSVPMSRDTLRALLAGNTSLATLKLLTCAPEVITEYLSTALHATLRHLDIEFYDAAGDGRAFDRAAWAALWAAATQRRMHVTLGQRAARYMARARKQETSTLGLSS